MAVQPAPSTSPQQTQYRLVLEGELSGAWAEWFGPVEFATADGHTVLEIGVLDQAQLHAVLHRVHDLHLPLVSVMRIEPVTTSTRGGNDERPA